LSGGAQNLQKPESLHNSRHQKGDTKHVYRIHKRQASP